MAADLVSFAITTFVALFAIVNPIGAMTFFVVLTRSYPKEMKGRVILMAEASFPTFDMGQIAVIVGSILATMGITWVLLYQADRVFSRIGRMGAYAISRIIGLILAAIAVQFVILGIQGAIVSYFR